MSGDLDLEQRYRRVLRLLPGYYREMWEEDMVAAFLDSWMTGDEDEDSVIMEFDRPSRREIASVVCLAARLYLGGPTAPRRYLAWGQAVRGTVLAVLLIHTMAAIEPLTFLAWLRHLVDWLPAPPAIGAESLTGGLSALFVVWCTVSCMWIVVYVALLLGYYRAARIIAVLMIVAYLVPMVQAELIGDQPAPFAMWSSWILLDLAPVLAMSAFRQDAPPVARRPWLLALLASFIPPIAWLLLATKSLTPEPSWVPDFPGECCLLVAIVCLVQAPRARSGRPGTGESSLTLILIAAFTAVYRIATLGNYLHDPHLLKAGGTELIILVTAAALIAQDAVHTQIAVPAPPPQSRQE
jgi:hypothetical protein